MKQNSSTKRAALYIRVSSEEQAMHGLSLEAQRKALYTYACQHHWDIAGLYADEGVSARKKYRCRAAFMRMLHDIESGKIDVILFIKLDRWFRNIADYYEIQRILDAHQVAWIATEERYDTTTANGRLNLNIRLSIAQDESDRTAERIQFVFQDKLRRGEVISGKVPLGYRIEKKHLVPDPEKEVIARAAFEQYLNTRSICAVQRYLLNTYECYYTVSGLRALLANPRYIGHAHGQSNFCPPLIDTKLFEEVQRLLTQRSERLHTGAPRRVYLFIGLAYCAECGHRLCGHTTSGKYIYYRCSEYYARKHCIHHTNTNETMLEHHLLALLEHQFRQYQFAAEATPTPINSYKIQRKLQKLRDLYLNNLLDRQTYEQEYISLQARQGKLETPADLPNSIFDITSLYHLLTAEHKKVFWARVLSRVDVNVQNQLSITFAHFLP